MVLNNINLTINDSEFITILGPSGCGKSTILRLITGLEKPDAGNIIIDGKVVNHKVPKERQIGMVFQQYALFPNLNVLENIAFGLRVQKLTETELRKRVYDMISLVGLEDKVNQYPAQLSGGQQQRVALARSLVVRPKVLLLDEPLSALDAQIRKNLQIQLRDIQQQLNTTMVLVTHDQEEAMNVSDRIVVMNQGRIEQIGTPTEIYTHPQSTFIANFIGNYNVLSKDQLSIVLGEPVSMDGKQFAIRPEVVSFQLKAHSYNTTGVVSGIRMKGAIVQIEVNVHGEQIVMEQLNDHQSIPQVGATVQLAIPKDALVKVA